MTTDPRGLGKDRCIELAKAIHRGHAELIAHAAAFGDAHDLEVVHLSILHSLGLAGPVRMGDLAQKVVVDPAGMTRRAAQLEARGLLVRERSATSQREVLVKLTKAGEDFFRRSFSHLHAAHRAYFDDRLSKTEQRQLAELLAKL